MKKRKINPTYLRAITASDVKDAPIDALDLAISIKEFAEEYLRGIMTVSIEGTSRGNANLKLPVATYLVRLLCETAADDAMVDVNILLGDEIVMKAHFEELKDVEDVAYMVRVAKLAGFEVTRDGKSFSFSCAVKSDSIMKVYAASMIDFKNMLVTTYKM